jgi:outer membrane autotransporter protein
MMPGAPALAYGPDEPSLAANVPYVKGAARSLQPLPPPPLWTTWATGTALTADLGHQSSHGTPGLDETLGGIAAGVDYRGVPDLVLGFGLGGAEVSADLKNSLGKTSSDVFQVGVYGSKAFGAAYVSTAFAYSNASSKTERTVSVSPVFETLDGHPNTDLFSGRLEAGWRYAFGPAGVTPYAAVEVQSASTDAYNETSNLPTTAFGLSYRSKTDTGVRTELGSRFDIASAGNWTVFGRVAWVYQDLDAKATALFEASPVSVFTINGTDLPRNAALLSLGSNVRINDSWNFTASADTELSGRTSSIGGRATLRYLW